jgi:hypothetical protein
MTNLPPTTDNAGVPVEGDAHSAHQVVLPAGGRGIPRTYRRTRDGTARERPAGGVAGHPDGGAPVRERAFAYRLGTGRQAGGRIAVAFTSA